MSFNMGLSSSPYNRLGGLAPVGIYFYESVYYRQWVSEVALAFYEGRADEFVHLDLVKQFREPDKQQIIPLNLTKEIIDETSILYKEDPVYQIVDENDKVISKDQKLWEEIMEKSRYKMIMDKVDRWCKLIGTPLVKVGVIDPNTGLAVEGTTAGDIQLDVLHGGVYDVRYGASPYYITELLIGVDKHFSGYEEIKPGIAEGMSRDLGVPGMETSAPRLANRVGSFSQLGDVNRIYWTPDGHKVENENGDFYETKNPYKVIPAVAFFNQDPAHYYFLPVNEPLLYANHAVNMRLTDLNHIAKFQAFGIPVMKGAERPKNVRQGRPFDDFNQLKGGSAQGRFGGATGMGGFGAGGNFRNYDAGFGGMYRDGNANANALGMSLGPDTAITVGEKGDFKFAHPNADIKGLIEVIQSMCDFVRINHGLRPKHAFSTPPSAYALWTEKQGVIDENAGRRGKIFAERESQLFHAIKNVWNEHHKKSGEKKFSPNARLKVTYQQPKFPLDPKTQTEKIIMEVSLLDKGDKQAYRELYPHLSDSDINKMIKQRRKDKREQKIAEAELEIELAKMKMEAGITESSASESHGGDGPANRSKSERTVMKGEGGSPAGTQNMDNKLKKTMDNADQDKPTEEKPK